MRQFFFRTMAGLLCLAFGFALFKDKGLQGAFGLLPSSILAMIGFGIYALFGTQFAESFLGIFYDIKKSNSAIPQPDSNENQIPMESDEDYHDHSDQAESDEKGYEYSDQMESDEDAPDSPDHPEAGDRNSTRH